MHKDIRHVFAFSPVSNEPLAMIQRHGDAMQEARRALNAQGVALTFMWASDGAPELPDDAPMIVRHPENLHLATTLRDAYRAILDGSRLKRRPDLVIKLDSQEHDPAKIIEIVDQMRNSRAEAMFVPVVYWVKDDDRRPMREVTAIMNRLSDALSPVDTTIITEIYNQVFPLGYQCFLTDLLEKIMPDFNRVMDLYQEDQKKRATWGMDLVSLVLAAHHAGVENIDMIFGGWMEPWATNRMASKVEEQRQKVATMLKMLEKMDTLQFVGASATTN